MKARRGDRASVDELRDRELAHIGRTFAEMFAASGIDDAQPLSATVFVRDGQVELRVVSESRGRVTIGSVPQLEVANLFADAGREYVAELAGAAPLRRGRRPGTGSIEDDTRLCEALKGMGRATRATLAARAGFTEDELRGYLRRTNRTLADLTADCAGAK